MTRWPITFSAGAKPGKRKREDIIGTKESKKQYEINRECQFQQHWLDKTPWLRYDDGKGMTCNICCEQNISSKQGSSYKNMFITGSKNFKYSTIADHG